jgi:hypothetical protein
MVTDKIGSRQNIENTGQEKKPTPVLDRALLWMSYWEGCS